MISTKDMSGFFGTPCGDCDTSEDGVLGAALQGAGIVRLYIGEEELADARS